MSKHTWNFDQKAINEAAESLGIKYPIKVVGRRGRPGSTCGQWHGLSRYDSAKDQMLDEPTHFISVQRSRPASMASKTIWHELVHALQCEQWVEAEGGDIVRGTRSFLKDYAASGGSNTKSRAGFKKYKENKYEVEAVAAEVKAEDHPLVKLTKFGKALYQG